MTSRIITAFLTVSALLILLSSCGGTGSTLFLTDSIYAAARSLDEKKLKVLPPGGDGEKIRSPEIRIVRDLGDPVPEVEEILAVGYGAVLVSPYLAEAVLSIAPAFPGSLFGIMYFAEEEDSARRRDGPIPDNCIMLELVRTEAVIKLAQDIARELNSSAANGRVSIVGIWRTHGERDREDYALFRETLVSEIRRPVSIKIDSADPDQDELDAETYIRDHISSDTVLGVCFAGPMTSQCARIFWEYGIPIAAEALSVPDKVWGPVSYTLYYDWKEILAGFGKIPAGSGGGRVPVQAQSVFFSGKKS